MDLGPSLTSAYFIGFTQSFPFSRNDVFDSNGPSTFVSHPSPFVLQEKYDK